MKTFFALFVAAAVDAQYSKSSKSTSLSYNFADISKSSKSSGLSGRDLHESHDGMSYRMLVPSKASKASPKSGKGLTTSGEALSYPQFLIETNPSKSSKENIFEVNADDYAVAFASKSSKGSKEDHIFGRLLVDLDSMSYSNVIVPGKSGKLQPKSGKKKETSTVNEFASSKAGKSGAQPETRSSTVSLKAIDFTKSAASEVTPTESSRATYLAQGLATSCVLAVALFSVV